VLVRRGGYVGLYYVIYFDAWLCTHMEVEAVLKGRGEGRFERVFFSLKVVIADWAVLN